MWTKIKAIGVKVKAWGLKVGLDGPDLLWVAGAFALGALVF